MKRNVLITCVITLVVSASLLLPGSIGAVSADGKCRLRTIVAEPWDEASSRESDY